MLYGMLFIPRGKAEDAILKDIREFRNQNKLTAELKWSKVSKGMLPIYQQFIDIFFCHPEAEFKCLVVDRHKIYPTRVKSPDRESAFFQFYASAISQSLSPSHEYIVFADDRQTKRPHRWSDMQHNINEYWQDHGVSDLIVRNLLPVDSKQHDLLQIADLFTGAIGYDFDEYNTSKHRLDFIKYITEQIGCSSLRTFSETGKRFEIKVYANTP